MADADALRDPGVTGVPGDPGARPAARQPRPATRRSCRSSTTSASSGRGSSGASSRSRVGSVGRLLSSPTQISDLPDLATAGRPGSRPPARSRSSPSATRSSSSSRSRSSSAIILAMPVLLYQLWAFVAPGSDAVRAQDRPPVDPARAALLRARRRDRLRRPAVRGRVPAELHRRDARPGHRRRPVLRLRDDDVPRLRARSWSSRSSWSGCRGSGILTSQRLHDSRRMVILGIAIFAAVATPGGDLVSPFVLGGTMYILFELTTLFIKRSGR